MNAEQSQNSEKKTKPKSYLDGAYQKGRRYNKSTKNKGNFQANKGKAFTPFRPRFQSDEDYSQTDHGHAHQMYYHTPNPKSDMYGFQSDGIRIEKNVSCFSGGFQKHNKVQFGYPMQGYYEEPHQNQRMPTNNYGGYMRHNQSKIKPTKPNFHGCPRTNNFMRFHYQNSSEEIQGYSSEDYIKDLLSMVLILSKDFKSNEALLNHLGMTEEKCREVYEPIIEELRLNFKNCQNGTMSGPDKILTMLLDKLEKVIKKYDTEFSSYLPSMIESYTKCIDKSLDNLSSIDQNVTISNGSNVKCLKAMLESKRAKELDKHLTQYCFKVLYKLLFIGTPHEHYILQCKCKNVGGIDTDEEEKSYAKYKNSIRPFRVPVFSSKLSSSNKACTRSRTSSDPSTTECDSCGNKYKTAILSRLRVTTISCISQLCQLNSKYLVEYYSMIFPSFQNRPIEKELEKPNVLYFIIGEQNSKPLKEVIYNMINSFLSHSGLAEYLESSSYESVSSGKSIPDISPRSFVKLPKNSEFSASKTTDEFDNDKSEAKGSMIFMEKLHYLFYYLFEKEQNHSHQNTLTKLLCVLVKNTPYAKLRHGLVSETILPLLDSQMTPKIYKLKNQKRLQNVRANKVPLQAVQLIKELVSIRSLRSELKDKLHAYSDLSIYKGSIETLHMLGKNYPEMLTQNWPSLKALLEDVFSQSDEKPKIECLKMIEEWLNNFSKDYSKESTSKALDFYEKNTKESSSCSISKKSEEDKYSEDSCEIIPNSAEYSLKSEQPIESKDISPFKYDGFCEYLNTIFQYFLNESVTETDSKSQSPTENLGVFLTMRIVTAMNGVYQQKFKQNNILINYIIEKLYEYRADPHSKDGLKNSWIVANISSSCDLDSLDDMLRAKLFALAIMHNQSNKDKTLSNSARAIGYILSSCSKSNIESMFEIVNQKVDLKSTAIAGLQKYSTDTNNVEVNFGQVVKVLIAHLINQGPKVAWNVCVSLGNIIDKEQTREFDSQILFSDECFETFISNLQNQPKYKVKIHVAQTLIKYKSYQEYGSKFLAIWHQSVVSIQDLFGKSDIADLGYIENLNNCLIELFLHMCKCVEKDESALETCAEFLGSHHELLKTVFSTYISLKLETLLPSLCEDESPESKERVQILKDILFCNSELRNIFTKIQEAFKLIVNFIDLNAGIHLKFSSYDAFASLANSPLEEFATFA